MKQEFNKFLLKYFNIKEVEEPKNSSSSDYIIINGDKIPNVPVIPEPKLNLEAKVEKPIDDIDYSKYDTQAIVLNVMLVVFIIILIIIIYVAVYLWLQLTGTI